MIFENSSVLEICLHWELGGLMTPRQIVGTSNHRKINFLHLLFLHLSSYASMIPFHISKTLHRLYSKSSMLRFPEIVGGLNVKVKVYPELMCALTRVSMHCRVLYTFRCWNWWAWNKSVLYHRRGLILFLFEGEKFGAINYKL